MTTYSMQTCEMDIEYVFTKGIELTLIGRSSMALDTSYLKRECFSMNDKRSKTDVKENYH
jgi:hypothetical protein